VTVIQFRGLNEEELFVDLRSIYGTPVLKASDFTSAGDRSRRRPRWRRTRTGTAS